MGYLSSGAMAGVTGEYLKQSEEDREFKKQTIRDKRLSGLKKEEATHTSKLAGDREAAAYDREKGDYTAGYGDKVYRDDKLVAEGGDRPTTGTDAAFLKTGNLITLATGDQVPYDQLRRSWADQAFTKDEFGNPIRNPDVPGWDDWWNTQVAEQHLRDRPKSEPPPEPEAEEEGPGFFERLGNWALGDDEAPTEGEAGRGGMLSEKPPAQGKPPAAKKSPVKLKTPLTRAAKKDPVQMYDELMAQLLGNDLVSEEDIIDTIRAHFGIQDWQPPADALK